MQKNELDGYLILAPMAELTHGAFRRLIGILGGPDLYFTEMISAGALVMKSPYEKWYLDDGPDPRTLVYQLVGDSEDKIVKAAMIASERRPFGIDINMGCSVSHIVKRGWGVSWMEDAGKAASLIGAMRRNLDKGIKLSAKIRIGQKEDFQKLSDFAEGLCDAGVDFLTLHAKTAGTPASRPGNVDIYLRLAQKLPVPLIYNGMLGMGQNSISIHSQNPDAPLMIGRAAAKNPWIFAQQRGAKIEIGMDGIAIRFLELLQEYQPEDFWLSRSQRFFSWFCQNLAFGHGLFSAMNQEMDIRKMLELFLAYLERNPQENALRKIVL